MDDTLVAASRAAAATAFAELQGDLSLSTSPLFTYSESRLQVSYIIRLRVCLRDVFTTCRDLDSFLQIVITGYVLRVAETMSYRTGEILGHTGWSWFNRALRDTFLVPSNTFFRLGPPTTPSLTGTAGPSTAPPADNTEWELAQRLLPALLTHGLCNWFVKFFNHLRAGGDKGINEMMHPEELSFVKIVRQ